LSCLWLPGYASAQGALDLNVLRAGQSWTERLARDARLSFSDGSAREAREVLEGTARSLPSPLTKAFAYLALGSGGDVRDRPRLMEAARNGSTIERAAALFALGELKPSSVDFLIERGGAEEPEVAAAAALALARTGGDAARATVAAWAQGNDELASAARGALAFAGGVASASPGGAVETFLTLRWGAARQFGFVAGTRWKVLLEEELAENELFLDRVILGASVELREGPRRDHLLELLLAGGTPDRLRGVIEGMPEPFALLIASGLWKPAETAEWRVVLDQIARAGAREEDLPILELAAREPELRVAAGLLLVGAGRKEAYGLIEGELFADEPARRVAAAQALGGPDDKTHIPDLARLQRDPEPRVRAAALAALVRRRDQAAMDHLVTLLEGGPTTARTQAIAMLAQATPDSVVEKYLEDALILKDLLPEERAMCQVALTLRGRLQPQGALREMLASPGLDQKLQESVVRALGKNPDQLDLDLLRNLFPVEDAFELNVELAQALIQNRDRGAVDLLRRALWRGPWNRSVLAAGLLVRHGGIQALHNELASPPARASEEDLRRVGFGLGEWGGLSEVDVLARRRRSGDPALQGALLGALATRTQ
jgi:HEAT repeat protein